MKVHMQGIRKMKGIEMTSEFYNRANSSSNVVTYRS